MQTTFIAGNVGRDAELRTVPGGEQVLSFSVAVDNGKDSSGNRRDSTWWDCSIWGKRAASLQPHIKKGTKLALQGRPSARAHNEEAYLKLTVDQLTFQGGGQQGSSDQSGGHSQQSHGPMSGDMDEDFIPF